VSNGMAVTLAFMVFTSILFHLRQFIILICSVKMLLFSVSNLCLEVHIFVICR